MPTDGRFSDPAFECDLVLKGGITSGVVYPPAIVELATDHRFCSIGGTSAGAIAAASAAAAEVGRDSTTGGFERLERVPAELKAEDRSRRTKLFRLFQPQPDTRRLFDLIWNLRRRRGVTRVLGSVLDVSRFAAGVSPWQAPAVLIFALGLTVAAIVAAGPWTLLVGAPLMVVAVMVAGLVRIAYLAPKRLASNHFGLCSGLTSPGSDETALTDWLFTVLQELAGRADPGVAPAERERPLTFGDLAAAGVQLVVLSTNVSRGTSETIPFREQIWAFRPSELESLFPPAVIDHLRRHARSVDPDRQAQLDRQGLVALPNPEHLPVILAVRMSLSFPILLSGVPLYALTPRRDGHEWQVEYVQNWFSDGGITSNMPVHLFDSVLPRRPTYGINLTGGAEPDAPPASNIWRPLTARQGGLPPTTPISSIAGLLGAVLDTMQNWTDNDLSRAPGFRDRICTIRLGAKEGGMNLDMPAERIDSLVERGACAGDNLASIRRGEIRCRSDEPDDERLEIEANQWDSHRWTRFRMGLHGLGHLLGGISDRWAPGEPSGYQQLAAGVTASEPRWMPYRRGWTEARARRFSTDLESTLQCAGLAPDELSDGAPAGITIGFQAVREPDPVRSSTTGDELLVDAPRDDSVPSPLGGDAGGT